MAELGIGTDGDEEVAMLYDSECVQGSYVDRKCKGEMEVWQ